MHNALKNFFFELRPPLSITTFELLIARANLKSLARVVMEILNPNGP